MNTTRIVVNRAWAETNPAAVKLFEVMQLPVADINAPNERMRRQDAVLPAWPMGLEKECEAGNDNARYGRESIACALIRKAIGLSQKHKYLP